MRSSRSSKRFIYILRLFLIVVVIFSFSFNVEASLDGSGSGLVGWWKINEGSGTVVGDSSGNSHTGTAVGTPTWTSGQLNGALSFDAIDDKVTIDDFPEADGTTTLTVSAWVQPSVAATTTGIFVIASKMRATSGFSGWSLYRGTTENYEFHIRGAGAAAVAVSNSAFADTSMHHVVGVYNGTDVRVYVDGVLADTTPPTLSDALPNSTNKVCIGQTSGGGGTCDGSGVYLFPGVIDDVRIYTRALSATEVDQLYDNGIAGIETVVAPTVTTQAASSVTSTTATGNGNITSTGGDPVTVRGFTYGLTTSYGATTTDSGTYGTGAYTGSITSLTCNTLYHVRAYATNGVATSYGADDTFTTATCSPVIPTLTTQAATSVTSTSTVLNGTITDRGNENATVRGFVYGLTTAYGATTTENGSYGTGAFTASVGSLSCNTLYHFRSYATNSAGAGYGSDTEFTTGTCSPSITSFTVPSSDTDTTLSITTFTGMDNVAVTGYFVTDFATSTPIAASGGWTGSAPSSFTFRTGGPKTLYAWVKDGDGNVSATSTATTSINLSSYEPPAGIPDPSGYFGSFGEINKATPGWPSEWLTPSTSATTSYYFIDNSDGACTDSSNTYGHPDLPRCTPPEGSLAAGAFMYFDGGTYTPAISGGDRFEWYGVGTDTNPIWITGNPYSMPIFTDKVYLGYGGNTSYLIFENLIFQGAASLIALQPLTDGQNIDHIIFRNITRTGTSADGDQGGILIGLSQTTDTLPNSLVSYVVVYDVNISNIGYIGPLSVGGDEAGVYMGYHTDHFWVLDSIVHHVGADSVAGSHYSNNTDRLAEWYFIGRNRLYQNGENCVDLKVINHTVISENTCYGPFQDENGIGMVLHYGANSLPTVDSWVLFNKIYDAGGGVACTFCTDAHVIGNEMYNLTATSSDPIDGACFAFRSTGGILDYIDNTCYNYVTGVYANGLDPGDDLDIFGNIFSAHASTTLYDVRTNASSDSTYIDMDYNIFYSTSTAASFLWNSSSRNLAYMQGTAGECANCLEVDPLLTSTSTNVFTLQSGSPARDVSVENSAYNTFFGIYSINIKKDRVGVARPQNLLWDIGAHEYVVTDSTAPVISAIASSTTATTATITWTTNENATSTVDYGLTASYGTASSSAAFVTSHSITLTGLTSGTLYHFRVSSGDNSYNQALSSDYTFTTASSVSAPTITTQAASSLAATSAALNGSITATGGANATQSGFAYGVSSDLSTVIATSTLGSQTGTASFSASVSSLTCATVYYFRSYATNTGGTGYGSIQSFTTSRCGGSSGRLGYVVETAYQASSSSSLSTATSSQTSTTTVVAIPRTLSSFIELLISLGIIPEDKAEMARKAAFAPSTARTFTRDLRANDRGEDVRALQKFLNEKGFNVARSGPGSPGNETDKFGAGTYAALKRYQAFVGLPATGYFGPLTRGMIGK